MLALAAVTYVALHFVVAPYGRHTRAGWGPTLPNRLGWMLMESPSLFLFALIYLRGSHRAEAAPIALCAMWLVHYAHRSLVYPLRLHSRGKRMPIVIALMAIAFNVLNVETNAPWISELGTYPAGWLTSAPFLVGSLLFVVGFVINTDSDRRLFRLRAPGESGYEIPTGGLYEWITCPNYFGEIVEWMGWALASWSLGGLAFALYTVANLAPRASAHHAWYRARFATYPARRKALVPFIW